MSTSGSIFTGDVELSNQSDLRFGEATSNGSNYVGFQAPASITSNITWTLPATDASVSGYVLFLTPLVSYLGHAEGFE